MKKRRVNYNVTEMQHIKLTNIAHSMQLSASELLRRILDEYFREWEAKNGKS